MAWKTSDWSTLPMVVFRNKESLAHDNVLVEPSEARFIFEAVVNMLRFLKSIEPNS